MDRGQRAVVALRHRVEHRDDLVAEDLTDDDPGGVHTQGASHQLRHGDGALALGVGQAFLECDDVGVQVGEGVEAELQGPLDGDEALVRGDLVGEGPEERRLAGVGGARDHDVLAGADRAGQEVGDLGRHRAVADEVGDEHLAHARAADGQGGAPGDVHDGRQTRTVGEPEVELGVGRVEGAGGQTRVRAQHLDELDELLVGLGDGVALHLATVGVPDEHLVEAVDVDVLDLGVVQQRLEPADAEQGGVHGGRVLFLGLGVQRRTARVDLGAGVLLQDLGYDGTRVLPLVLRGHRSDVVDLVLSALFGDTVAGVLAEPLDQLVVDSGHAPAPAWPCIWPGWLCWDWWAWFAWAEAAQAAPYCW